MRLSLKWKVIGLVGLPLVTSCIYGALYLLGDWRILRQANELVENGKFIEVNSDLIHEIQIERAQTALYLGGKITVSQLEEQHQRVLDKWNAVASQLQKVQVESTAARIFADVQRDLAKFRDQVRSKSIEPPEATRQITSLIAQLIQTDILVASDETLNGMEMSLLSLAMLEMGKEYGGRLRAGMLNVLSSNRSLSAQQVSQLESLRSGIHVNLDSPAMMISPKAKEQLHAFKQSAEWGLVQELYAKVVNKATEGNYNEDPQKFYQMITKALNSLGSIVKFEVHQVDSQIQTLHTQMLRSFGFTLAVIMVLLVAVVILAMIMIRSLTKALQQTVGSLAESAETISSGSQQLTSASQQVASGAVESASSLEEVVASMEELNSIVTQNSQRAKHAAELSKEGRRVAESGKMEIELLMAAMSEIAQSSKRIEEIINVIDDIAFQTNLLALNAAVEAARAGEQGKGFAVVAEAVRSLAQRSAVAAKDVAGLIQDSAVKVGEGTARADSSGGVLTKILATIGNVSQINTEIAHASEEQATGLSQISKAINELDSATQQNASAAEEVSAFSDQMSHQAVGIHDLVKALSSLVEGDEEVPPASDIPA